MCHVTSDSYAAALGYQPPSSGALFGWVEKHAGGQHESAPRADDELVHVGDEIDEGVVVIINPCLSWSAPLVTPLFRICSLSFHSDKTICNYLKTVCF